MSECTFIRACIRHYRGSTKIDWEQRQRASGKTANHTERYSAFAAASENVLMWRTLYSLSRGLQPLQSLSLVVKSLISNMSTKYTKHCERLLTA